jgi:hypothetical protein
VQSELEHRRSKARYKRTNKKLFVKQLARIEHRETRLRQIRAKLANHRQEGCNDAALGTLRKHHHIGASENDYEHIGTFLRQHAGDPAIKVQIQINA